MLDVKAIAMLLWAMIKKTSKSAIKEACEISGGQASLARIISVSPANVQQWIKGTRPIPITQCVAIERATNGVVSRQALRPKDWHLIWPDIAENNRPEK